MGRRIDYTKVNPDAAKAMYALKSIHQSLIARTVSDRVN